MYTEFYQKVLFPLYESFFKRRSTTSYIKNLNQSQWLTTDALRQLQFGKIKRLLTHAYNNVPFYRKKYDQAGISPDLIRDFDDFLKIPFLTKDEIRENLQNMIASNYRDCKLYLQTTGGSTGTPLLLKHDHNNYEYRAAGVKRVYGWAGYKDGAKTVFIWGAPVVRQRFWKKFKHDLDEAMKRHIFFNTFYFDEEMMKRCFHFINRYRPAHIVAYTMPLFNFAKYLSHNGLNIYAPRSIITAAEKLFPHQRQLIENVFRAKVFETYGCREVSSIAGECDRHQGMHINMETIYMEVIKDGKAAKPKELGEVVLTDLTNYSMPFIRYKNDDIGSFSGRTCECGRGLELLDRVEGRVLDTIKTPDGKLIPGEFFIYWFMGFDEIKQFQIRQDSLDKMTVTMVQGRALTEARQKTLLEVIKKIMGHEISIDFRFVDNIPLTPTGKFRVVVSHVPADFQNN